MFVRLSSQIGLPFGFMIEKIRDLRTLQYIASPFAKFEPQGGEISFAQGGEYQVDLRIFGFVRLGRHSIGIVEFDEQRGVVRSNEHNRFVRVWNHRILLQRLSDTETRYTDEVEIHAGALTPLVWIWSVAFYRHRQRKWRTIRP